MHWKNNVSYRITFSSGDDSLSSPNTCHHLSQHSEISVVWKREFLKNVDSWASASETVTQQDCVGLTTCTWARTSADLAARGYGTALRRRTERVPLWREEDRGACGFRERAGREQDLVVTVGGNANWCSHWGKLWRPLKKLNWNYPTIQELPYWVFTQKIQKHQIEGIRAPLF